MAAETSDLPRSPLLGYLAAGVAVTIWAAWIVWLRVAVAEGYGAPLTPVDVGLLRFGAPMLLLAPVWLRHGLRDGFKPPETPWPALLGMLCWGAPFVLALGMGSQHVSVGHVGAMVPGVMPLWAAFFGLLLLGEPIARERWIGLALIGVAFALVMGPAIASGDAELLAGAPWLMAASALWAMFAVSYKRAGLGPVRAVGLVAAYSTLGLLVLALVFGSRLPALPLDAFLWALLLHGLLSGVVSIVTYNYAIGQLGATRAASLSALVPALAGLMGVVALGETLSPLDMAAIAAASLGVAIVNGAFGRRRG